MGPKTSLATIRIHSPLSLLSAGMGAPQPAFTTRQTYPTPSATCAVTIIHSASAAAHTMHRKKLRCFRSRTSGQLSASAGASAAIFASSLPCRRWALRRGDWGEGTAVGEEKRERMRECRAAPREGWEEGCAEEG